MSLYPPLTLKERETILLGLHTGLTQDAITKSLGRSKSAISREISRTGSFFVTAENGHGLPVTPESAAAGHAKEPQLQ